MNKPLTCELRTPPTVKTAPERQRLQIIYNVDNVLEYNNESPGEFGHHEEPKRKTGRKNAEQVRPRLMTEEDAARYLGVSRSFLNASRCYGNRKGQTPAPPYVRVGQRGIRYDVRDLDAWIDEHRVCLKAY